MHRPTEAAALDFLDLADGLNYLSPRQRMAVLLYSQGCTQAELGEILGFSQQMAGEFLKKSLNCVILVVKSRSKTQDLIDR